MTTSSSRDTTEGGGRRARRGAELARRWGLHLTVHRARARTTAYVYGNILVLTAVATLSPTAVAAGHGVVLVTATTVTTYLAHVLSHSVGGAIGRDPAHPPPRGEGLEELRDAVPIVSSGALPTLLLLAGWLGLIGATAAVLAAAGAVVVRLAGIGLLVARLSGLPPSGRQLGAGLGVAVVASVIVVLKVVLTH